MPQGERERRHQPTSSLFIKSVLEPISIPWGRTQYGIIIEDVVHQFLQALQVPLDCTALFVINPALTGAALLNNDNGVAIIIKKNAFCLDIASNKSYSMQARKGFLELTCPFLYESSWCSGFYCPCKRLVGFDLIVKQPTDSTPRIANDPIYRRSTWLF